MFIEVAETTVINVVSDLETRLDIAESELKESRKSHNITRDALYSVQDQLRDAKDRANFVTQAACTLNHFPTMGKIPMIRALRELYPYIMGDENARLGLKEAKDAVDAAMAAGKLEGV